MSIVSERRPDAPGGAEAGNVPQVDLTAEAAAPGTREMVFTARDLHVSYGSHLAVADVTLDIAERDITAIIGPSGCGKSTLLRCFNRMNDFVPGARVEGEIRYHGEDLYGADVDAAEVRRRIGMVFQKPNPFPKSIFDNVAYGPRINRMKADLHEVVEEALTKAALWDEVKDKLKRSAFALSGGQQQRLCIARALAVRPDVLLMDEPCSALDPTSTRRVEETIRQIAGEVTVVIVTHNMQQAHRVSDHCAFFLAAEGRPGHIVEQGPTADIFERPQDQRTNDYVNGRFG